MILNVYSSPNTTRRPKTTENNQDDWLWVVIVVGIVVVFVCVSSCMLYFHRKKSEFIKRIIHIPFPFYTLMRSRHQYQPNDQTRYEQKEQYITPQLCCYLTCCKNVNTIQPCGLLIFIISPTLIVLQSQQITCTKDISITSSIL